VDRIQERVAVSKMTGNHSLACTRKTKESKEGWSCPALTGEWKIGKHVGSKRCRVHVAWYLRQCDPSV
jgi:hypothetical protein